MPLPEIPDSWSKFLQLLVSSIILIAGVFGYSSLAHRTDELEAGQVIGHQKLDSVKETQAANGAKIDLAATAATEVKNTLAVKESKTDAKIEDLTKQVAALPTATADAVKGKMK